MIDRVESFREYLCRRSTRPWTSQPKATTETIALACLASVTQPTSWTRVDQQKGFPDHQCPRTALCRDDLPKSDRHNSVVNPHDFLWWVSIDTPQNLIHVIVDLEPGEILLIFEIGKVWTTATEAGDEGTERYRA